LLFATNNDGGFAVCEYDAGGFESTAQRINGRRIGFQLARRSPLEGGSSKQSSFVGARSAA
jgi:hypothetical protein